MLLLSLTPCIYHVMTYTMHNIAYVTSGTKTTSRRTLHYHQHKDKGFKPGPPPYRIHLLLPLIAILSLQYLSLHNASTTHTSITTHTKPSVRTHSSTHLPTFLDICLQLPTARTPADTTSTKPLPQYTDPCLQLPIERTTATSHPHVYPTCTASAEGANNDPSSPHTSNIQHHPPYWILFHVHGTSYIGTVFNPIAGYPSALCLYNNVMLHPWFTGAHKNPHTWPNAYPSYKAHILPHAHTILPQKAVTNGSNPDNNNYQSTRSQPWHFNIFNIWKLFTLAINQTKCTLLQSFNTKHILLP